MRRLLAVLLPRTLTATTQQRAFQLLRAPFASSAAAAPRQPGRLRKSNAAGRDVAAPLAGEPGRNDAALKELRQLEAALARHNELYYNQQQPEISDAAYDDLKRQYRHLAGQLRGEAPEEVALPVGAPVPAVGALRKVRHPAPMLSLATVTSREEAAAWLDKTTAKLAAAGAAAAGGGGGGGGGSAAAGAAAAADGGGGGASRSRSRTAKSRAAVAAAAPTRPTPPGRTYGWVVEPKVDGLAVRVLYSRTADGTYQLVEAATRGDGAMGEDVTHNALHGGISGLPRALRGPPPPPAWSAAATATAGSEPPPRHQQQHQQHQQHPSLAGAAAAVSSPTAASASAAAGPDWVDVRGEVFVRTADLQLVNSDQDAAGQPSFANTRNAASGAVRLLDPAECRSRRLSFVAYAALAPKPPHPSAWPPTPTEASPSSSTTSSSSSLSSSHFPSSSPPSSPPSQQQQQYPLGAGEGSSSGHPRRGPEGGGAEVAPLHGGSHWRTLQWLGEAGFAVSPDNRRCGSPEEALREAEEWMARRGTLGYDADGVVIKLDDTTLYDVLGTAGSDPRWAVAWKFPAGEAVTRLRDVELSVGRQGQITPVALLEPVELGGVTLRRASLHNVLRVLPELRPSGAAPWLPPSACPACGGPVRLLPAASAGSGDQLMCDSPHCGAKSERRLLHFAAVCLKGSHVSKGVVGQLMAAGLIRDIPDFYNLDKSSLESLPGFGPARIASLTASLDSSRRLPASVLLRGLNIRLVGEAAAAALGAAFPSLDQLAAATPEGIEQAAGVGPAVAGSVAEWFNRLPNRDLIRRLRDAGVECIAGGPAGPAPPPAASGGPPLPAASGGPPLPAASGGPPLPAASGGPPLPAASGGPREVQEAAAVEAEVEVAAGRSGPGMVGVAGLRVCVTGTLQGPHGGELSRNDFRRLLEEAGGQFHSAVKRDTEVLLVGADGGARKPALAAARGVQVMREPEFWGRFWSETRERV
ncbi:hypothetical protein PLESTF_000793200 [Pleodorina starrii]|nr:hypothetical protein PLESTF_000793200 [Pleodorina starrii]